MAPRLLTALLLALALAGCSSIARPVPFEVYLVRHAEKADTGQDPELTNNGRERAERLAEWFSTRELQAVWSSDYRRTRQTAAPSARQKGLPVRIYDPRALDRLATELLNARENALVVGHSNTTPELAGILCRCDIPPMAETEYDRLIVIGIEGDRRYSRELGQAELSVSASR